MSKNLNEQEKSGKVVTKYDLKKQKKAEAKAKEARSLAIWRAIGILFVIAIVALIAYFPIRNVYRAKKTVFTVGNYAVSQVEYDYYYNATKDNYLTSYASILSYMGISADSDFSTVAYSDNLTFADYFQKLAVEQLQQNAGLKDKMAAEGFTCDATEYYNDAIEQCKAAAKEADVTLKDYIKASFGSYATAKNIKPVIEEAYVISQYIEKAQEELTPSDEDIEAYYKDNKEKYDVVSYYMTTVTAALPTEPTELADELPIYGEDGVYSPSQAEIDAAMAEAKANAEFIMPSLAEDGSLHEDENADTVAYAIKSWLFDSSRAKDDEEIIEGSNMYYLVKFVGRHRADEVTVDARIIITDTDNGAEIMAEYEAGGANLDSFLAANDKYSTGTAEGALYEGIQPSQFIDEMNEWFVAAGRKEGDVASFYEENGGYTYVVYYVGQGAELWAVNAKAEMLNTIMEDYLKEVAEGQTISDPDGFIVYLQAEAVVVEPADIAAEQ